MDPRTPNVLTVDVEDFFHVSAFEAVCPPAVWERYRPRIEGNTYNILEILHERGVRATFFVLGWVAERFPALVKRIAGAGHEVASHGYWHRRVYTQRRDEFRDDVRRSKALLEDATGERILGYRAPSYSISQSCLWAFDELFEAGYTYDSSVFPIRHDLYGMPFWPRFPCTLERLEGEDGGNWVPAEQASDRKNVANSACNRRPDRLEGDPRGSPRSDLPRLFEVPITTLRLGGRNFPIAGGGYFRLFPYPLTRWGLRRINVREGRPFVFYVHPWELDPEQPRIEGVGLRSRLRHYVNLEKTEGKFKKLLEDFAFGSARESFACSTGVAGESLSDAPLPRLSGRSVN